MYLHPDDVAHPADLRFLLLAAEMPASKGRKRISWARQPSDWLIQLHTFRAAYSPLLFLRVDSEAPAGGKTGGWEKSHY